MSLRSLLKRIWRLRLRFHRLHRINLVGSSGFGEIAVPADEQLAQIAYVRRLAADLNEMVLSRREMVNWIADQLYNFQGRFVLADGSRFHVPDVEDVLGELSFKWVGEFLKWEDRMPAQAIQQRMIPRIRLLAMARDVRDKRWAEYGRQAGYRFVPRRRA